MNDSEMEQISQQWSLERKYKSASRTSTVYRRALEHAFYERFGDEAIEIIRDVYDGMAEGTLDGMKTFGIEGNDAKSFAYFIKAANEIPFNTYVEIVEASPKRAVVRWLKCAPPAETNPKFCYAHLAFEKRAVKMLNPKLEVEMPKCIACGDPYCEEIIVLED